MSLEQLVRSFQIASREGRHDESTDLYSAIDSRCLPIVVRLSSNYRNLGNYVEDVAVDTLHDCLISFPGGGSFKNYFTTALTNRANSEYRRRKRFSTDVDLETEDDNHLNSDESEHDVEQLNLYVFRKRKLIDSLSIRNRARYSTMLLDQRWRQARLTWKQVRRHCQILPSAWVESVETWHLDDNTEFLDGRHPPINGHVWNEFASKLNASPESVGMELMVQAMNLAGANVTSDAWRQRVCRYLHNVKDQVSESEWKYFHAHLT